MRLLVDVEATPPPVERQAPLLVLGALHSFAFKAGGQFFAVETARLGR
jgi:hypothetical protein